MTTHQYQKGIGRETKRSQQTTTNQNQTSVDIITKSKQILATVLEHSGGMNSPLWFHPKLWVNSGSSCRGYECGGGKDRERSRAVVGADRRFLCRGWRIGQSYCNNYETMNDWREVAALRSPSLESVQGDWHCCQKKMLRTFISQLQNKTNYLLYDEQTIKWNIVNKRYFLAYTK